MHNTTASSPLVSIVITNFNRRLDLQLAVESVLRQDYANTELLVVDNGSTDGSQNLVASYGKQVQLLQNARNTGMAGYSVGFSAAKGSILFQMDNDSILPSNDVIRKVVQSFGELGDNVAILACRVHEYREGDDLSSLKAESPGYCLQASNGYHAGGVAFRAELLRLTGYYNEEIFLYGAELFLQTQVIARNLGIAYNPDILVFHRKSPITRSPTGIYYEVRNRLWYIRLYGTRYQQFLYIPQVMLHDFAYGFKKRATGVAVKAIWHGVSRLPTTLGEKPMTNSNVTLAVQATVDKFTITQIARRIVGALTTAKSR